MAGQTINDRLLAARHSIAGQGLAKSVCKATTEEMIAPKKKHLDCEYFRLLFTLFPRYSDCKTSTSCEVPVAKSPQRQRQSMVDISSNLYVGLFFTPDWTSVPCCGIAIYSYSISTNTTIFFCQKQTFDIHFACNMSCNKG